MDNVKPWQIILFVLAIGVLAFSAWRFVSSSSIPSTGGYMTVDIMTGQLYDIQKGKAKGVPLPARHPDTDERTLYPVNQVDDLLWEIPSGYDSFLTDKVRKGSVLKDGKFTVETLPEKPIRFKLR